jgi:hypothetical protein
MIAAREKTYRELTDLAERARQVIEQIASWMVADDDREEPVVSRADAYQFISGLERQAGDLQDAVEDIAVQAKRVVGQIDEARAYLRDMRGELS